MSAGVKAAPRLLLADPGRSYRVAGYAYDPAVLPQQVQGLNRNLGEADNTTRWERSHGSGRVPG